MLFAAALAVSLIEPGQQPRLPPPDSPPLVRTIEIAFPSQGNTSLVDPATYLYYIQTRPSRPSEGVWVPYDPQSARDDFHRLWATGFLDDLSIEATDEPWENGVIGKHITFKLEERQRVKIVDYDGSKAIERPAIEEKLKAIDASIRLDTFIDVSLVRKVERTVREMLKEKGFQYSNVTHTITPLPGSPKLIHLTFHLDEGPKVRIKAIDIVGNTAVPDGVIKKQMKGNTERPWWLPSFLGRRRVYQEGRFEDDADRILQYYRDRGYITTSVGNIRTEARGDSSNGRTRWVALQVPVVEGKRYRIGKLSFEGNTVVQWAALESLFALRPGEFYSEALVRKGLEKARDLYGAGGYFEFTGYPDLVPRDQEPVVDVTIRLQEGRQYFINRIAFTGNTFTRDAVIRRELSLVEGGVFNTEALKTSVRRLNQLAYFKPLEDRTNISVEKAADTADRVNVTFKVEEQNRNQLTFGAGMSQYEGFFGSLSYTTANLIGRGESASVSLQRGSRSNIYQISFAEPYLFSRPISGSIDLYSRKYDYLTSSKVVGYSEVREGSTVSMGWPVKRFSRTYLNYTYEVINVATSDDFQRGSSTAGSAPLFDPYAAAGRHIDSRFTPTFVHNTVDNPIMPHRGRRITASVAVAGRSLRGSYNYLKPDLEAIVYLPTSRRTGFGARGQAGWLRTYGTTTEVPYYLRYFLGGEYQIRGVDIRTVGPVDEFNRAIGGNKYVLFNAEYYLDIAGPVRALLFHDAGQAFSETQRINLLQMRTSSGVELRVFMPVLNVPMRLIWAWNQYRDTFQPARSFKFAIGTTF